MKRIIAGVALSVASTMAFAGTDAGCGFGSMIFKGQAGIGPHVLAATTNGSFGNQTFGMTFGTLGCDTSKPVTSMAMFMDNNIDKIARDVSRGQGENLDALAVILGIEAEHRAHFAALLQQNFATIFPTENVTSDQASDAVVGLMKSDEKLAAYVS
ncbi:MAG: DUF3015 domain-containing protein [Ketobacteraceae bacterium]|nr:DUF3015 domain-containing protein [Ketobacteraceae bacterium]